MESTSAMAHSHNTIRALSGPRPALRGVSHRAAAILSVPAAVVLSLSAPSGTPRLAAAVFGAAMAIMFSASALTHYRRWSPDATEILFRLDHTAIYIAIFGTLVPVALLGLDGGWRTLLLAGVGGACAVGIAIEWLPFATPRGVAHTMYLALSWTTVLAMPRLLHLAGWSALGLLLAGGVAYTVGAVIVAVQRPDPRPHVFGYHEIWHLLVIVGATLHYLMVGVALLPTAA